ncbi:MAG: 7-cyano-7-deazaguanine reductase [Chthoniobacter sp.]|nr:7-cyano-7-deazaguanine reductase [Chthoniobacter sp.]
MPSKQTAKYAHLKLLGKTAVEYPAAPTAATLETFENRYPDREYWIRFDSPEFTSMCPVTGQPDFAAITIDYVPGKRCIESKSLKFYLASFRNTRSFNEEIVNRILDDLVKACQPRRALVHGKFAARGGISVTVDAAFPSDEEIPAHRKHPPGSAK